MCIYVHMRQRETESQGKRALRKRESERERERTVGLRKSDISQPTLRVTYHASTCMYDNDELDP